MSADPLAVAPAHEPVNVSEEIARAANEPAERITRPANEHAVKRIVKRESVPVEEP